MDREEVRRYIQAKYGIEAETPWKEFPRYLVFRHPANRKWFALLMNVPRERLGLEGEGELDVLDVKLAPMLVHSLEGEEGFLVAYHMNKKNWLTVLLDGSAEEKRVKSLIDDSFQITANER